MGKTESSEERLIDFLYIDQDTIDSLYAQIFSGNINSINKSESEISSEKSKLTGGLKLINGEIDDEIATTKDIKYTIDPNDYKIVELLEQMDIENFKYDLSGVNDNQLIRLQGDMLIRNTKIMSEIISISDIFGGFPQLSELNKPINPSQKGKKVTMLDMIKKISVIIPKCIEIEVNMTNEEIVYGILREEYMSPLLHSNIELSANTLPKDCIILGVINRVRKNTQNSKSQVKQVMDQMAYAIYNAFAEGGYTYTIKPILIYRYINL